MQITLAYVCSLDGFMTDSAGNEPATWASPEDQAQFQNLVRETGVVMMGSTTYESHKHLFVHREGLLRIVMTSAPEKHEQDARPDQLEFTSLSPCELVETLKQRGFKKALIAGGPKLFAEFFRSRLITHLHVTIEPLLFGSGIAAATGIPGTTAIELIDSRQLNTHGTLLLRYKVV